MFRLSKTSEHGIHAVPYRRNLPCPPVQLADGTIVDSPSPEQLQDAKAAKVHGALVLAGGVSLGLPVGPYLFPSGEVGVVYGAKADPIPGPA
jgi:hypothetical protein